MPIQKWKIKWGLLSIAAATSFSLLIGCSNQEKKASGEEAAPLVPITVAEVKKGNVVQGAMYAGLTEAIQQISVSPLISGRIRLLEADLGSYVKKGQILARLDEGDLNARIRQAQANVRAAEQQINQTKVNIASQFEQAKTAVKNADVAYQDAMKNWERMNALFQQGAISQQQMEQANTQKAQAQNQWDAAKESYRQLTGSDSLELTVSDVQDGHLSGNKLNQRESSLTQAKIGVEQAKANLDIVQYQAQNLLVKAPIDGFVTEKRAESGEFASPQSPLFIISNLDQLHIKIDVPETVVTSLKIDQSVTVDVPGIGKNVQGKIVYVSQVADNQTQAYPVKVRIDNAEHEIKGGMVAQVRLENQSDSGSLMIPADAMIERDGKHWVYLVNGEQVKKREIEAGLKSEQGVQVLSGLKEGEVIVHEGKELISESSKIKVVKE